MKSFSSSTQGSTAYSVSSDNSAIGVTVTDQSLATSFNSSISVTSLAVAQTLEFSGFSGKNTNY